MKLLFVTDLHGLPGHIQGLARWADTYRPDLLLVGGDALPDADPDDPLGSQVRFLLTRMRPLFETVKARQPNIRIATILGNHDWLCTYDAMASLEREGLLHIIRSDNPTRIGEYAFLGYWFAPPCPYIVKDFERLDFPGQTYQFDGGVIWDPRHQRPVRVNGGTYLGQTPSMREDLDRLPPIHTPDWILVAHAPPFQTDLDILTGVGHVGSQSIKDFILRRQPLLSLHGHIHESPRLSGRFWQLLGRTIAVNPGQRDDALAAVLIDLEDEAITLTPLGIEGASGEAPVTLTRSTARRPA
jgi:Icc-related predicted phosphoesterase